MQEVALVRRNGEEITVYGAGSVAARIRASQRHAETALEAWMSAGRLALDGWSGPHTRRFVQAHGVAAGAWQALIDGLARNAAACESIGTGGPTRVGGGGACPTPLTAPGGEAMLSADPDRLRRFTTRALDTDPRSLIGSVTYAGMRAESVPINPGPVDGQSFVLAASTTTPPPAPAPTPIPVHTVVTLDAPRAEASRVAEAVAEAAAFAALVADGVEHADTGLLMSLLQLRPATELWAERLLAGRTMTPVEIRVAAGKRLYAALIAACNDHDSDRVKLLYRRAQQRSADFSFMAGFLAHVDDVEAFEAKIKDGAEPRGDFITEFKKGVAESILGTAKFTFGLSEWQMILNPRAFVENWKNVGRTGALLLAGNNPELAELLNLDGPEGDRERAQLYRSMVDLDTWKMNPAKALGHLAPDLAAIAVTKGLALEAAASTDGLNSAARVRAVQLAEERWAIGTTQVDDLWEVPSKTAGRTASRSELFSYLEEGEVPIINGQRPQNFEFAGKGIPHDLPPEDELWKAWTPELQAKAPNGIKFNDIGFMDIDEFATEFTYKSGPLKGQQAKIAVSEDLLTGDMAKDRARLGLPKVPGYTWHHVEDGHTMILVDSDIHGFVNHTGGRAVARHIVTRASELLWLSGGGV